MRTSTALLLLLATTAHATDWAYYGGFPYVPRYNNPSGAAAGIGVFQNPLVDTTGLPYRWAVRGSIIAGWQGCTDLNYYPQFSGTGAIDDNHYPPGDLGIYHACTTATFPNLCGYWAGMTFYPYGTHVLNDIEASFTGLYGEVGQSLWAYDTEITDPATNYNPELYFGCNTNATLYPEVFMNNGSIAPEQIFCHSYYSGYTVVAEAPGNSHYIFSWIPTSTTMPAHVEITMRLTADQLTRQLTGTLSLHHIQPWPQCDVTYNVIAIPDYL